MVCIIEFCVFRTFQSGDLQLELGLNAVATKSYSEAIEILKASYKLCVSYFVYCNGDSL